MTRGSEYGGKGRDLPNAVLASVTLNESKELLEERLVAIMKFKKRSKLAIPATAVLTVLLAVGAMDMGAWGASTAPVSGSTSSSTEAPVELKAAKADDSLEDGIDQSMYHNFHSEMSGDQKEYEIKSTLYQGKNPRSLVEFEKPSDTRFTVKGSITLEKGNGLKLIYKEEDGTLITVAEAKAGTGEPVTVSYDVGSGKEGEFYFEAGSAVCKFDLIFTKADEVTYYLTNMNPAGIDYDDFSVPLAVPG